MADNLYSSMWYRVADLKPHIRSHTQINRHDYRGQIWYIIKEPSSGQYHRFTPAAYHFIGLMDGNRSVDEIWQLLCKQLGDDAPSQDETMQFLSQLHVANVLQTDVIPDSEELFKRHQRHQNVKWKQRLMSPLALRFPLWDPDRFLARTLSLVKPFFSLTGLLLWLGLVIAAAVQAGIHWSDLADNAVDQAVTYNNLFLLWLIYPAVKALHELGHAYAAKVWGGEVHEMGIMLLVLMPIPYVEASSATAFPERYKRVIVSAAGIMVELFLASIAMFVWLNVEAGPVRAIAFNVMLIGGISTLFFNGNPLLRFDGYYIFSDLIEMPNLASRSKKYLAYLTQRYLFSMKDKPSPAERGERGWLVFYGIASFMYRMFIMFVIILFIAGELFFIGVLLAAWAVSTQLILPLLKMLDFLINHSRLKHKRYKAISRTAAGLGMVFIALFVIPAPSRTLTEGIVWLPERSHVRMQVDGFVDELLVLENSMVEQGQALVKSHDPFLEARSRLLQAQHSELKARLTAMQFANRSQAEVIRKEIESVRAEQVIINEKLEALTVYSKANGLFIIPSAIDMPGRFMNRGDIIGYVLEPTTTRIRTIVSQNQIGLVRNNTLRVDAWIESAGSVPQVASIDREVPGGIFKLPSAALGSSGGGNFPVDLSDPEGLKTLERFFQFDLLLPDIETIGNIGGRVNVRFDHGYEPLAIQWYRQLKQLLLSRFEI
ncbi:peptidase M50 [Neptuniibacter halophilus]|uniref:peptidase M50 n=1 Tax=Neptuniibacter halophilus TaxID=651666 RepID=UPI0025742AD9|nr:peptidase M50 [Neptuniibacter halophilus]